MTHPFETAGLGEAPFRYIGMTDTGAQGKERRITDANGLDHITTPGGTCAYCGQSIIILCKVRSSDGRRFHVGSDCVEKVDETLARKVKRDVARRRKARQAARIEAAKARLADPTVADALSAMPHPKVSGMSALDWAEWMMRKAGHRGKLSVAKTIEGLDKRGW